MVCACLPSTEGMEKCKVVGLEEGVSEVISSSPDGASGSHCYSMFKGRECVH